MAFMLLTSVLHVDKTILLLGKASHEDLPAQILPFPLQASRLHHNAAMCDLYRSLKSCTYEPANRIASRRYQLFFA
jgi:hypothetical protein